MDRSPPDISSITNAKAPLQNVGMVAGDKSLPLALCIGSVIEMINEFDGNELFFGKSLALEYSAEIALAKHAYNLEIQFKHGHTEVSSCCIGL